MKRCGHCGAYLPNKPFYFFKREEGILSVWLCPNCRRRHTEWNPTKK